MAERKPVGNRQSSRRTTLRDVAREAGVSVATASRVLNGSPYVSQETRDGVQRVFARLDYAPDPLARALNAGGTNTVGAVIPTIDHAIFAAFLQALEAKLDSNGYSLLIATTGGDPRVELERARSLLEMGARALIVSGLEHEPELTNLVRRFGAPLVATSIYDASASLPTIGYDNAGLARRALRHLLDLGHADVALVHGPAAQNDRTRLRIRGAESVEGSHSLRKIETELSVGGGVTGAQEALSWDRPPTALLCVSDLIALGAMFELQRNGFILPRDMSVMGFDNISWSQYSHPPLTCMSLPVAAMGQESAQAICSFLEEDVAIPSLLLEGEIKIRGSTCRRSNAYRGTHRPESSAINLR